MKHTSQFQPLARVQRRNVIKGALAATAFVLAPGLSAWANSSSTTNSRGRIAAVGRLGKELLLQQSDVDQFRASLRGQLLTLGDDGYNAARKIWNGSFDRRPALIARCASASDVVRSVKFARSFDLLTAVRGGGHSISGQSVCEGGLVIDLSMMKGIRVDPAARTAQAQGGVKLGELDHETQAFGLVTTLGTAADTGIAGLTLGGGIGRLARKYGLACDNLRSVDIVTANGDLLRASERENADLFWAVRGGGGNFGVVTMFEYQLHPFGGSVLSGWMAFPATQARATLLSLMEFAEGAPDELYLAPGVAANGKMISCEVCYCGPQAEGERLLAKLRTIDKVLGEGIAVQSYVQVQAADDAAWPAGQSYYFKSGFLPRPVTGSAADTILESLPHVPPALRSVALLHVGGAARRIKPTATAYWNRDAELDLIVWGTWNAPEDNEKNVAAMRTYWDRLEPLTHGYYINTDTSDNERRLRETYGRNYEKLVQLKNKYDPLNRFNLNANIKPTVQG